MKIVKGITKCGTGVKFSVILFIATGFLFWRSTGEQRKADGIITRIEDYRNVTGRLPDPEDHEEMRKLGFELRVGWHPDFHVYENGTYQVTIIEGFDGPYWVYDSGSRKWAKGFPEAKGSNVPKD